MIEYKTRNTSNPSTSAKSANNCAGRGAATSAGLCVSASGFGLRCRCLVEKENTRCRPRAKADENKTVNFELRSRCGRAEVRKTVRYSDPEWMLGKMGRK